MNNNTNNDIVLDNVQLMPFGLLQAEAKRVYQQLNDKFVLVESPAQKAKVAIFVQQRYEQYFPAIDTGSEDSYGDHSFVFYSEDEQGNIVATASLMVDNAAGFSEEQLFESQISHYRAQGLKALQIGRFIIDETGAGEADISVKDYFRLFYTFSKQLGFDIIVGLIKQKDIAFHQKMLGAEILCPDSRINYGGKHTFAVASWHLDKLKPRFFKWAGCTNMTEQTAKPIYQPHQWQNYARSFASVQTSFQRELQLAACELLYGDVADFGCGSAKLAPFLADSSQVSSYLGIDYAKEMIKIADWLIAQFDRPSFNTFEGKIEDYHGRTFNSAVSLNSYYTWPDPVKVLRHIHALLKKGGRLVLATPNHQLDMFAMEKEVKKELLTHPDFATFRQINLELTENPLARFVEMDTLVKQLQAVGFVLDSCHQSFYLGGLNFVVVHKI